MAVLVLLALVHISCDFLLAKAVRRRLEAGCQSGGQADIVQSLCLAGWNPIVAGPAADQCDIAVGVLVTKACVVTLRLHKPGHSPSLKARKEGCMRGGLSPWLMLYCASSQQQQFLASQAACLCKHWVGVLCGDKP